MKKLFFLFQLSMLVLFVSCSNKTTIGFFVKAFEDSNGEVQIEDWFKEEIRYAQKASKDMGFSLVVKELLNADAVYDAINDFADKGGDGIVLCSPDISIGEKIKALITERDVKLITVDDRLQDNKGNDLAGVPHVGIWGYLIGETVSSVIADEIIREQENIDDVGVFVLQFVRDDNLKARTDGAVDGLIESLDFPMSNFFYNNLEEFSPEAARASVRKLYNSRKRNFSKYVIFGGNDDVVIAAVKELEALGLDSSKIIGVGINGSETALKELETENGFFATIKLRADVHGYETCRHMNSWLTKGIEPKKDNFTNGEVVDRDNLFLYKGSN